MGATLYPIDANADKRSDALREVSARLEDIETVLYNTKLSRRGELVKVGEGLRVWQDFVRKEKLIYETLNFFNYDVRRKTLIAEGWVPTRDITTIQLALRTVMVSLPSDSTESTVNGVFCRRNLAPVFLPFCTSSVLPKRLPPITASTSSRSVSRPSWTRTERPNTRKSIPVSLLSSRSRSYSLSCLVILDMGSSFSALRYI
jgi:hypothetical protein